MYAHSLVFPFRLTRLITDRYFCHFMDTIEFIKSRQRFNRDHKSIVSLVQKLNKTGSVGDLP
jgi:hypothetical protein